LLPELSSTDLLSLEPDAVLDLWSPEFNYDQIPGGFGCYAFISKETREVVYIGSACAHSPDLSQTGLRMRMRFYKDRGKTGAKNTRRVRNENKINPLLVLMWASSSQGDCRKYEDDAIRLHKPRLNIVGLSKTTLDEYHARKRVSAHKIMARNRSIPFNPDAMRVCTKCKLTKPCREFRRNRNRRLGTVAHCKQCEKELL